MGKQQTSISLMKRMRYITIALVGMGIIALISLGSIAYLLFGTTPSTPDVTTIPPTATPTPCPIDSTTNTLTYQQANIPLPTNPTNLYTACDGDTAWTVHIRFGLTSEAFQAYLGNIDFNGDGQARYVTQIAGYEPSDASVLHFLQANPPDVFEIMVDRRDQINYMVYIYRAGNA